MAKKGPKKKETRQIKAEEPSPARTFADSARPFPLWGKFLIGFVVLGQLAVLSIFCMGMIDVVDLLKKSVDPVFVKQQARTIADFADPLPAGFEYRMGFSVTSSGVVSIVYQPDQSEIMFGMLPEVESTARERVDSFVDNGIPNVTGAMKVEEKSTLEVGGRSFEYSRATASDGAKNSISVLIACTVLPNKRAILIFGRTPGSKFNMDAANKLFGAVRRFNVPDGKSTAEKSGVLNVPGDKSADPVKTAETPKP